MKTLLCCATVLAGTGLAGHGARAADVTVGRADASRPVAFDVMMPLRNRDKLESFVEDMHRASSPNFHKWLTPASFGMRFGPETAKINAVADALRARGFAVSVQTRSVHVTGTAAQVEAHFGAHLLVGRTAEGVVHIKQETALKMPAEIAATGAQIYSFSPHVAHTNLRRVAIPMNPDNRQSRDGAYWFTDLKQAYAYPGYTNMVKAADGTMKPADGSGVTLGVLMSSDVYDADIYNMFAHENFRSVAGVPTPKLFARVLVNGGATTASPALAEASLDTQQQLTGAPGAHVVLYDIPDLSDGNVSAGYISIVEQNAVDLVSSSFGGCELGYSPAYNGGQSYYGVLDSEHELFLQGNAQGITFLASSGDQAGLECPSYSYFTGSTTATFVPSVSTPAADPAVTAVGGTNLVTAHTVGSLDSTYVSENGWSDPEIPYDIYGFGTTVSGGAWGPGGGVSAHFAKPSYQNLVKTINATKRSLPDIGMLVGGCPGIAILAPNPPPYCNGNNNPKDGHGNTDRSAVWVSVGIGQPGGGFGAFIGTSVSAPELAGAMAHLIERKGRMGNLNYYLYGLAAAQAAGKGTYFHVSIPGYNNFQNTNLNSTYSYSVGVGTPIVKAVVQEGALSAAGTPQTPSNP